jgi:uncharacterized membrane protein YdjX (TVP38/TMEM64 family)
MRLPMMRPALAPSFASIAAISRSAPPTALLEAPIQAALGLQQAPVAFGVLYALCDLLIPLNVGLAPVGGALYGARFGIAVVLTAGVVAATAAFFIGRLFRTRVLQWMHSMPQVERQFAFIDRAITNGGFRAVFLLRLIPTPIPALNYLYGLTGVAPSPYIVATALGNLPGTAMVVLTGAMGKQLFSLRSLPTQQPWWAYALAVAAVGALLHLGARGIDHAKRALDELAGADEGCRPWLSSGEAAVQCEGGDDDDELLGRLRLSQV